MQKPGTARKQTNAANETNKHVHGTVQTLFLPPHNTATHLLIIPLETTKMHTTKTHITKDERTSSQIPREEGDVKEESHLPKRWLVGITYQWGLPVGLKAGGVAFQWSVPVRFKSGDPSPVHKAT